MGAGIDPEFVSELFAAFGPVAVRRMFSGGGVFCEGLMIALIVNGVIHLKADERTIADFRAEGLGAYKTKGGRTPNSYWRMPERLYDDLDELAVWARRSLEAARRKKVPSPAKRGRPKPKRK